MTSSLMAMALAFGWPGSVVRMLARWQMVSGAGVGAGVLPGLAGLVGAGAGVVVVGTGVGGTAAWEGSAGVAVAATASGSVGGDRGVGVGAGCAPQEVRRIEETMASTTKRLVAPPNQLWRTWRWLRRRLC